MKRGKPLRRVPLRRARDEGPTLDREPKPWAPPTVKPVGRSTYSGSTSGAKPKTVPQRNRRLLNLAENMPCLLLVPDCCNHRTDSTCACHSNLGIHGKAGRRKADDFWSCWGCAACHWWLDFGQASQEQKTAVFMGGMALQALAWKQIAADADRPPADRRAAQWGLDRLPQGVAP